MYIKLLCGVLAHPCGREVLRRKRGGFILGAPSFPTTLTQNHHKSLCIFEVVSPAIGKEFAIAPHVHAPYGSKTVFKEQGGVAYEYACLDVM